MLEEIIVHCSATKAKSDIGAREIREWHMRDNNWSDIGYHFVIRRDGTLEIGRPISYVGSHAFGHNRQSIGICLVGGVDENLKPESNFTFRQFSCLHQTVNNLIITYPSITKALGHKDLPGVRKECPCFNVQEFMEIERRF